MAESTLSMTYSRLLARVGDFLGLGRDSTAWDTDTAARVGDYIRSGYRQFLVPETLGAQFSHEWRFLHPIGTVTTEAGEYAYEMDDDFGGIDGNLTYAADEGFGDIVRISEGQIRSKQQFTTSTGRPTYAAVRWKAAGLDTEGQRAELIFWLTPDDAYVISFPKILLMNELSASYPYPLGGMKYSEVLLELCLAAAELAGDDEQGIHQVRAERLLLAAISQDKTTNTPATLGYNSELSDRASRLPYSRLNGVVTINGVEVD